MSGTRGMRFQELFGVEEMRVLGTVVVVGAGAVGRPLGMMLATMGCPRVVVWDGDEVSEENVGVQGYYPDEVGWNKSLVLVEAMRRMNPEGEYVSMGSMWSTMGGAFMETDGIGVVISCVDKMDVRLELWKECCRVMEDERKGNRRMVGFVDCRMAVESCTVVCSHRDAGMREYKKRWWFPQEEGEMVRCTSKSTVYAAEVTAGLAVQQYTKMVRGEVPEDMVSVGLQSMDMLKDVGEKKKYDLRKALQMGGVRVLERRVG